MSSPNNTPHLQMGRGDRRDCSSHKRSRSKAPSVPTICLHPSSDHCSHTPIRGNKAEQRLWGGWAWSPASLASKSEENSENWRQGGNSCSTGRQWKEQAGLCGTVNLDHSPPPDARCWLCVGNSHSQFRLSPSAETRCLVRESCSFRKQLDTTN